MKNISSEFSPSLIHPFYFIRNGLKNKIAEVSVRLTGKMMDFGCGSKPYRSLFNVTEYIGVDYYNEGHPHSNEQIDVFYDGKTIPFPDETFDAVLASEVFEHVFNLDEILKELNRVMKKDAHLLITCPFVWNEHEVPNDYARYTRFALESMLVKHGFSILTFSKSGNFITTVFQMWNLYWFTLFQRKQNRFFLTRWFYKFFLILPANLIGAFVSKIFPSNDSLYLNNVMLVKKN